MTRVPATVPPQLDRRGRPPVGEAPPSEDGPGGDRSPVGKFLVPVPRARMPVGVDRVRIPREHGPVQRPRGEAGATLTGPWLAAGLTIGPVLFSCNAVHLRR